MVKATTAAGIAGMWFIAWQVWQRYRGATSLERYKFDAGMHRPGNNADVAEVMATTRMAAGTVQERLLNVNNFGPAELEVRAAQPDCGCWSGFPGACAGALCLFLHSPAHSLPPPCHMSHTPAGQAGAAQLLAWRAAD